MCECIFHRYHCFHITPDGEIWSHSQNSCDALSAYELRSGVKAMTLSIEEYHHGMTADEALALYEREESMAAQ